MKKLNISRESAETEASRLGMTIREDDFAERLAAKGRPKKSSAASDSDGDSPKRGRGRPRKEVKKVAGGMGDDLIAELMKQASSSSDVEESEPSVAKVAKVAKAKVAKAKGPSQAELKAQCKAAGLKVTGNKGDLLARLSELTTKTVQVVTEEPVQVVTEEPVQVVTEEPVQVVTEEPVQVVAEETVQVVKEEPVQVVKEESVQVVEEETVQVVKEESVQVVNKEESVQVVTSETTVEAKSPKAKSPKGPSQAELKAECKAAGLKVTGNKGDLQERLTEFKAQVDETEEVVEEAMIEESKPEVPEDTDENVMSGSGVVEEEDELVVSKWKCPADGKVYLKSEDEEVFDAETQEELGKWDGTAIVENEESDEDED